MWLHLATDLWLWRRGLGSDLARKTGVDKTRRAGKRQMRTTPGIDCTAADAFTSLRAAERAAANCSRGQDRAKNLQGKTWMVGWGGLCRWLSMSISHLPDATTAGVPLVEIGPFMTTSEAGVVLVSVRTRS